MADPERTRGFSTRAIHHGYDPLDYHGALNPPVFLTSTFAFPSTEVGAERFQGAAEGYIYGRVGNPTVSVLEKRLAALEDGEAALATSSGMGALTAVIWTLLKAGDEIVADKTLYGCTFALLHHQRERFGIVTRFADLTNPGELKAAKSGKTRLVLTETPSNPNMRVIDIAAIAEICRKAGILFAVDNTYCTPYLQKPIVLGADIVVHSATKYLGGHGDLLAGAVVARKEHIDQFRFTGVKEMNGACISAFDASLILRGLKTLSLRMDRHCETALKLAHDLEGHPAVERVYFPGLDSHPRKALASRQMRAFGGMIAMELKGGLPAGRTFMNAVQLATRAVSLGDAETLIQHPASMTHATYTSEERNKHGFTDGLIRLSVGLEDYEDVRGDLIGALEQTYCDANIRSISFSSKSKSIGEGVRIMNIEPRDRSLKIALVTFGVIFCLVYPMGLIWPSGWVWHGGHGQYYLQMICGIYAVLGIFLIAAARNPDKHRSLILFTIWSSIVHAAIMAAQAIYDGHELGHLVGDVPALLLVAGVLWYLMPSAERAPLSA